MRIIGGTHKNHPLKAPKSPLTRPTTAQVRETLFNICQNCVEGSRFLDLFAGSGGVGFEALSRGAAHATLIDNSRQAIDCMHTNSRYFSAEKYNILCGDVLKVLQNNLKNSQPFDIIYVDPPYQGLYRQQSGKNISYSVAILEFIDTSSLLSSGGLLFIEDTCPISAQACQFQTLNILSARPIGRATLTQFSKKPTAAPFA